MRWTVCAWNIKSGNGKPNSARTSARDQSWRTANGAPSPRPSPPRGEGVRRVCGTVTPMFALLRRQRGRGFELLHLGGTIFEFGDFAERIERRIGEQIGGCLRQREWNEYDALRHLIVLPRRPLHPAAGGLEGGP